MINSIRYTDFGQVRLTMRPYDRDDVLDALASVVDELGFECDRASSAAVGANLLASRPYDVALVDLEMT